jgi:phosphoribosylformylglycinamidine cyclo-ligase
MAAAAAALAGVQAAAGQPRCQQQRRQQVCRAEGLSYKDAGVDIDAGNELVKRIQKLNPNIGGFSGMVPFGERRGLAVEGAGGAGSQASTALLCAAFMQCGCHTQRFQQLQ